MGYSVFNNHEKVTLSTISESVTHSIGTVMVHLLVGNTIFITKFSVMKNLPVPGIIGADFLKKHTLFISENFEFLVLKTCNNTNDNENVHDRKTNTIANCYENNPRFYQNRRNEVKEAEQPINNYNEAPFLDTEYQEEVTSQELDLDTDRDCDVIEYKQFKKVRGCERMEQLLNIIKLDHLTNGSYRDIKSIIQKFNHIFFLEGDELTYSRAAMHEIETTTNIPINKRQYRMPESTKSHIDEQIAEMLKLGIIKPSKSPWNAPVLCVPKKCDANGNKRYRIVVDFRALNLITKPFVYPIPLINEILDNIGNSKFFSSIDLKSGFYQIPIDSRDAAKTAFSTSKGHYEFTRMPMGLKNSPSTFQKLMNTILYEIQPVKAFVYLDDIVVFGTTIEEHNLNLCKILEALRKNNLKVEPEKCNFLKKEIKYLGHIIDENGIRPTDENIKTIKNMKRPQTIRDVRSFLGTVNFYGKFIPNMADKRKHLNNLLKKDTKFIWTKECEDAFNVLKNCLISEPILVRPNFKDTFVITTDASDYAIGAVLSNEKTNDHPIAFASRALSHSEKRYFIIEKELLAIVWAIEYFKHYIFNQHFIVYTDHRPLIALWRLKETSPTLSKLRLKIQGIGCEIRYKQGKENIVADFLSRMQHEEIKIHNTEKISENLSNNIVAVVTRQQRRQQTNSPNNIINNSNHNKSIDDNENQTNKLFHDDDGEDLNTTIDSLQAMDIEDETIDVSSKQFSLDDFFDAQNNDELDFKLLKFSKTMIDFDSIDGTFVIINSKTAFKELSQLIDLPHGMKDYLDGKTFSFSMHKIWGIILNGSKRSTINIEELFDGFLEGFTKCPNFAKSAENIQIISFRNLQRFPEINILRFFANKFEKFFTLYASEEERIFVKVEDRETVLKEFHDAPLGGHVGGKRMLKRISPLFKWDNMKRDVENYVRQCESCQKNKIWPTNKIPMKITTTSSEPFQKIYMDIIILVQSEDNNRYGLVIQDDLTRFLTVAPMPDQESETVAKTFVDYFICRYGCPLEVVTDQGANFMSSLMKNVCKLLKIKKICTSAYHPQANLVERSNRELKIYLRQFILGNPESWDSLLPFFTFEYNSTINSSTGYSPFELLYGRAARIPTSIFAYKNDSLTYDDYIAELRATLKGIHEKAKQNLIISKNKRKIIYDRHSNEWQPMWGDLVLVQSIPSGVGKKLQSLWRGPYEVVDIPSEQTTIIKNGTKLEKIHNNRLKKFYD